MKLFLPVVSATISNPSWQLTKDVTGIEDTSIYEVNKDLNIPDGDIKRQAPQTGHSRSTINDDFFRWELPIPIELSSYANRKTRGEYKEARKEYELRTCIQFKDWEGEDNFISIYPMSGCWSYVGHVYPNQQNVSIQQPGCDWSATIEHELMHALGIYHEQSRPDRDAYVFIDEDEVTDGHLHNFNKYDFSYVSPVGTEYAYDSIMHYGPYSFNKDPNKPTIVPRIGYFLDVIGQRKVFSVLDTARINAIYDCADPLRKSFNCNFNLMNICGFVNEPDETMSKWTQYDVFDAQNIGGTFDVDVPPGLPDVDGSAHVTESGRFLYITGDGALQSRVLDHTYSEDQCIVIWTYFGGAGSLEVQVWETEPLYGGIDATGTPIETFTIERTEPDTKWQFTNYNARPGVNNFKLRLVSKTSSFIAVDDISVQEVECRHNTFVIPDYRQKLATAQAQVDEVLASNPEADIYDTDLVPDNTWWSPRMIAKSGHEFQVRVNFVGRNSYLGRDYSKYTSAYLFMVPGDTNNDDQLFWPWADQFFKLFVRDQNPNVVERMDQHVSYVTLAEDGDGNRDWEKPVDSPTGGYGRYSFITHFDMLINQHGYFTKHDNVVFQGQLFIFAKSQELLIRAHISSKS